MVTLSCRLCHPIFIPLGIIACTMIQNREETPSKRSEAVKLMIRMLEFVRNSLVFLTAKFA